MKASRREEQPKSGGVCLEVFRVESERRLDLLTGLTLQWPHSSGCVTPCPL